jgi:hypothetical protein
MDPRLVMALTQFATNAGCTRMEVDVSNNKITFTFSGDLSDSDERMSTQDDDSVHSEISDGSDIDLSIGDFFEENANGAVEDDESFIDEELEEEFGATFRKDKKSSKKDEEATDDEGEHGDVEFVDMTKSEEKALKKKLDKELEDYMSRGGKSKKNKKHRRHQS